MSAVTIWFLIALICILAEFVIPGAVLVFLGIAAGIVGLSLQQGWVEGFFQTATLFFLTSLFLVLVVRSLCFKLFPGESKVADVDQENEFIGSIVEVIQPVSATKNGRVRFRGAGWEAVSDEQLEVGDKVIIQERKGQILIISSLDKGGNSQ